MLARDNHSSSFRTLNYGRKKFYKIGPWDCFHKTSFKNEPNKLEFYITLDWKGVPVKTLKLIYPIRNL